MRRLGRVLAQILLVGAVAWSALWYGLRGPLSTQLDNAEQLVLQRGGAVSYRSREIEGGFPRGYTLLWTDLELSLPGNRLRLSLPWLRVRASVLQGREIEIEVAPEFAFTMPLTDGTLAIFSVSAEALRLRGTIGLAGLQSARIDADALSMRHVSGGAIASFNLKSGPVEIEALLPGRGNPYLDARVQTGPVMLDAEVAEHAYPDTPVHVSVNSSSTRIALPVAVQDQLDAVTISVEVTEISVGESLWATLDPAQVLPRDPIRLSARLEGRMRWLVDPRHLTPVKLEALPFEAARLALTKLEFHAAGLRVAAEGEGKVIEGELPVAIGTMSLEGYDRLVEGLTRIGLLDRVRNFAARAFAESYLPKMVGSESRQSALRLGADGLFLNDKLAYGPFRQPPEAAPDPVRPSLIGTVPAE